MSKFYAYATEAQDYMVKVRGKLVLFDKQNINSFYQLQDILDDEYTKYLTGDLGLDTVLRPCVGLGQSGNQRAIKRQLAFQMAS